jgi:hypothetical protein
MRFLPKFGVTLSDESKGNWNDPDLFGSTRIWWDATNKLFRSKLNTDPTSEIDGAVEAHVTAVYGDESDGAVSNITDADFEATTVAQSGVIALTSNRIIRATGVITLSQTITVNRQDGQARGAFPVTHGSPGVELGAILRAIGTKGMPVPIRPGADGTGLCGGILQLLADGNVIVGGAINATGTNTSGDGGGGGGLVVIVSSGTISGSSNIDTSGSDGHATPDAKGGAGGYSGASGGHAGVGGSGGGAGGFADKGAGGAGIVAGNNGGAGHVSYGAPGYGGGGGGSLDTVGTGGGGGAWSYNGGVGGDGDEALASELPKPTILVPGALRPTSTAATAGTGGTYGGAGAAGSNGGGGGGGGTDATGSASGNGKAGGDGGDCGSGGGGGGIGNGGAYTSGDGGDGAAGNAYIYVLSSRSPFAGMPGGQGGGGGGGTGAGTVGSSQGTAGNGGTGASGLSAFVASMGNGDGGDGASGSNGATSGGAGGDGGNGGGAAGLVVLIAPTITYNGTVTGRLVKISGSEAENIFRSVFGS